MPTVSFKLTGDWGLLNKYVRTLPKNLEKVGDEITKEFTISTQRRARYRITNRRLTGELSRYLKMKKTRNGYKIETVTSYAWLQEFGFRPHFVPNMLIEMHMSSPGSTTLKHYYDFGLSKREVFKLGGRMVSWKGPFIRPAIKAIEKDANRIIKRIGDKYLKKK